MVWTPSSLSPVFGVHCKMFGLIPRLLRALLIVFTAVAGYSPVWRASRIDITAGAAVELNTHSERSLHAMVFRRQLQVVGHSERKVNTLQVKI